MKISKESAEVVVRNSPFCYFDGWDTYCQFTIDPAAAGDPKGTFNRGVSAWGYEKRFTLNEEGYFTDDE